MRRRPPKQPIGIRPELLSALAAVDFEVAANIAKQQKAAADAEKPEKQEPDNG